MDRGGQKPRGSADRFAWPHGWTVGRGGGRILCDNGTYRSSFRLRFYEITAGLAGRVMILAHQAKRSDGDVENIRRQIIASSLRERAWRCR